MNRGEIIKKLKEDRLSFFFLIPVPYKILDEIIEMLEEYDKLKKENYNQIKGRYSMINEGLFTSNSDEWETPLEFFMELDHEFDFKLDPCATKENAKCPTYFTKEDDDGLKENWAYFLDYKDSAVFMNPPYGREVGEWVRKAYEESQKGLTVVCLLPARTDTRWFHDYCLKGEIRWIKGRLKFSGMKNSAPFPSMIVIFRKEVKMDIISQIFNEIISIFGINEKEANEKGLWEIFEQSLISILCEHYGKY